MIFGMALLAYFAVRRALMQPRRTALTTGVAMALAFAALLMLSSLLGPQARDYALAATFVIFVIQLLLGVPIGFVLLMATLLYLHTSRTVPLSVVPINMQGGISSFVMLSIPFFILAGYVMTAGGLSGRLTDFVISLVGRFRGGCCK
ncbi:MAG: TRAP transporter large permease subunit [Bradyrhizobium sp.]